MLISVYTKDLVLVLQLKAAIDEDKNDDKISSSSSEVAQHDDDASDEGILTSLSYQSCSFGFSTFTNLKFDLSIIRFI